jgi:hypothetical protein
VIHGGRDGAPNAIDSSAEWFVISSMPAPMSDAAHMTAVAGRFQPLRTVIRGAALSDAELAAFWVHLEQGRWDGPGHIAPVLAATGALRPGLSAEPAADIMYGLTTPDTYESLVQHRGWSPERFERWLADVCVQGS